jgi:hypothetical protein
MKRIQIRLWGVVLLVAGCATSEQGAVSVGKGVVEKGVPRRTVHERCGAPASVEWAYVLPNGDTKTVVFAAPDLSRAAQVLETVKSLDRPSRRIGAGMSAEEIERRLGKPASLVDLYPREGGGVVRVIYPSVDGKVARVLVSGD